VGVENAPDGTRSDLEWLFLRLCRAHGLPEPENNSLLWGYEVDFLWRDARVVIETDSYRYHRGRAAFEDDRARDLELRRRGSRYCASAKGN
jgi:very-short-patch-repair endonuclease